MILSTARIIDWTHLHRHLPVQGGSSEPIPHLHKELLLGAPTKREVAGHPVLLMEDLDLSMIRLLSSHNHAWAQEQISRRWHAAATGTASSVAL